MTDDALRYRVLKTSLPGDGFVKLSEEIINKLGARYGDELHVYIGKRSLMLVAREDLIYSETDVRLAEEDMDYLKVEEGDFVYLALEEPVKKEKNAPSRKKPAKKRKRKSKKRKKSSKRKSR